MQATFKSPFFTRIHLSISITPQKLMVSRESLATLVACCQQWKQTKNIKIWNSNWRSLPLLSRSQKKTTRKQLRNDGPSKMSCFKNYPNSPAESTLHECSVLSNKNSATPLVGRVASKFDDVTSQCNKRKKWAMECHF